MEENNKNNETEQQMPSTPAESQPEVSTSAEPQPEASTSGEPRSEASTSAELEPEANTSAEPQPSEEPQDSHKARNRRIGIAAACVAGVVLAVSMAQARPQAPAQASAQATETVTEASPELQATSSPSPLATIASPADTAFVNDTEEMAASGAEVPTERPHITPNFDHSAILGSSTTQGLYMYGTFPEPDYYYHTSLTLDGLYDTIMDGADKPIMEALGDKQYDQIFLSFGLNELGWSLNGFLDHYTQVIDSIREKQPQAVIYIESILPVGPQTSARNRFNVNQQTINEFNDALAQFAMTHGAYFIDVSTGLKDVHGFLPDDISTDGIHLNPEGCARWTALIKANVEGLLNSPDGPVVQPLATSEGSAAAPEDPAAQAVDPAAPVADPAAQPADPAAEAAPESAAQEQAAEPQPAEAEAAAATTQASTP